MTEIILTKVPLNEGVLMPTPVALASDGAKIVFNQMDTKTLIVVENSHTAASPITFKKGTGIQSVIDFVQSIPAGKTMCFTFESGAFKNKGYIYVTGATTLKIAAVVLP